MSGVDAIERLCRHAIETRGADLPEAARAAVRTFVLDSIGVGVAGSAGPFAAELAAAQSPAAAAPVAVWGRGERLAAPGAALCHAYQIHNSEYDCVHEAAVIHPMAVLLGAASAWLARRAHRGEPAVDGRALTEAIAVGVDVACHVGVAVSSPLRFFRPATAGAFAATAALGRLAGFDVPRLVEAMGIVYGQCCGTMQAHTEGSTLLGMQVGFNARNAVLACDMAALGITGPHAVLEGPFGYLRLFEGDYDADALTADLGRVWRITEVAHKPFPSGRATHGIVDACLALRAEAGFAAGEVEAVAARVPSLTHRLIGRPPNGAMTPNYARLCGAYVAARALLRGRVDLDDFTAAARSDPDTLALAHRVTIIADDNPDPNALAPVEVSVALGDGRRLERTLEVVYGNPARPMPRDAQVEKFRANWQASATPLAPEGAGRVIDAVEGLEAVDDVAAVFAQLVPAPA